MVLTERPSLLLGGILTVLLQCPSNIVQPYMPQILSTVNSLMGLTSQHQGHLPSSVPAKHRSNPYVQICHGSPGILLLLATLKATYPADFEDVRRAHPGLRTRAVRAVWDQGLVQKGLGICHGVTGNAWPMLLLSLERTSSSVRSSASNDQLSRALAFLLHATELPPLSTSSRLGYRTPDRPFSLFEGFAGAVCAWADACAVIQNRRLSGSRTSPVLGFPGMGGVGPVPVL